MSISFTTTGFAAFLFFFFSAPVIYSQNFPAAAPSLANPPAVDTSLKDCQKAFKALFPNDDQIKYEMACYQDSIKGLMLENSDLANPAKALYLQCLYGARTIRNIPDSFVTNCAQEDLAHAILNPEYSKCFKATEKDQGSFAAYQECQDPTYLIIYKSEEFINCNSKLKDLKQQPHTAFNLCKSDEDRTRIASNTFDLCRDELEGIRIDNNTVLHFCNQNEVLKTMANPGYKACRATVAPMTKTKNVGVGLCSFSPTLLDLILKNPDCFHRSVQAGYKNYVMYSAFAAKHTGDGSEKNYFLSLIGDCALNKKPTDPTANPYLKLIKDYNLHTSEQIEFVGGPKPHITVGGASALSYDPKNEILYVLSDESYAFTQAPARMYLYNLNKKLELQDLKTVPLTYGSAIAPHVDGEGLVRLQDGRFVVSSEVGESTARRNDPKGYKSIPTMNLNLYSQDGSYLTYLSLPASFKTKYLRVIEKSYLKLNEPSNEPSSAKIDKTEKIITLPTITSKEKKSPKKELPPMETFTTESVVSEINDSEQSYDGGKFIVPKARLYLYGTGNIDDDSKNPVDVKISHYTVAGLQYNKSIESLGISPDDSTLFIANEASLYQDMGHKTHCIESKPVTGPSIGNPNSGLKPPPSVCHQMIRIARMKRVETPETFKPFDEFKYELEAEVENGVSEILALSSLELLVLERSWNVLKQKVTARIFKVKLSAESLIQPEASPEQVGALPPLNKQLILDLDDIIDSLSPGFKSIDNFEGLTFGPTLENGNRTLLMITDNNFSHKQKTQLLVFEILQDLLEKKP